MDQVSRHPSHEHWMAQGAGEDYQHDFYAWFRSLTPEQRADVRGRWPEPQEWAGYFDMLEER